MKRSLMRRKAAPKNIPPSVRAEVLERCGGWCEVRTDKCSGRVDHLHHRLMRSAGGRHEASNLLGACHSCHHHIHANPSVSYERGWLLRRGAA